MRTLLICQHDAELDRKILAPWLASFSELAGVMVIQEAATSQLVKRAKREVERSGVLGFADVLAFRLFYKLAKSKQDAAWEKQTLATWQKKLPPSLADEARQIVVANPNSTEARKFVKEVAPDVTIARCKFILKKEIFGQAKVGTFVMHPGHCPEYRNAHGCFWAIAQGDLNKVAMTLLKVDEGIDTGPVYGYYTYPFDAERESHFQIQARVVLDNLDALADKLRDIAAGKAATLPTHGRPSAVWGQPRLMPYLRARRRRDKC
jgi:hypothetical protein